MKKRLISLLVALCMAVTLLPVSAITAWAEESSSSSTTLRIENGYPVGTEGGTQNYSGNGWKFENGTLTLESGSYDFSGEKNALGPLNPDVQLVVEPGAKLTGGAFKKRAHWRRCRHIQNSHPERNRFYHSGQWPYVRRLGQHTLCSQDRE